MLDSRKEEISLREAGCYSYSRIMLGIREIIRLSSKLSGVSFHTRNRLPRFKLNYRVCLYYYYCYSVLFLETKKEFGKAMKKKAGCRIFVKEERDFGIRTPPSPPFRPLDTGRKSTSLIRKQLIRNVKKQTKIHLREMSLLAGTTFQLKSNFAPNLNLVNLEPKEGTNKKRVDDLSYQPQDTSLTLPQLKRMRQASMSIIRRTGHTNQRIADHEISANNSGFEMNDNLEKDLGICETKRNEEALSTRTFEFKPEMADSPVIKASNSAGIDTTERLRKSGTSPSPTGIQSYQTGFHKTLSDDDIYQLRESYAPESKVMLS